MKLGYIIYYVQDVEISMDFFQRAFGITRRFLHDSKMYGEMETGETALAFVSHQIGAENFPAGYLRGDGSKIPLGMEIALVTEDIDAAHQRALETGAFELAPPTEKPWGQWVSWVKCPDGLLVELCTPMEAD